MELDISLQLLPVAPYLHQQHIQLAQGGKCLMEQLSLVTHSELWTVPPMSAIKEGHLCNASVIQAHLLPSGPLAADCHCSGLTCVPGPAPASPLVQSHASPSPAVWQVGQESKSSGSAVGQPGLCPPSVCDIDSPD
jgi:hypothetical protein